MTTSWQVPALYTAPFPIRKWEICWVSRRGEEKRNVHYIGHVVVSTSMSIKDPWRNKTGINITVNKTFTGKTSTQVIANCSKLLIYSQHKLKTKLQPRKLLNLRRQKWSLEIHHSQSQPYFEVVICSHLRPLHYLTWLTCWWEILMWVAIMRVNVSLKHTEGHVIYSCYTQL